MVTNLVSHQIFSIDKINQGYDLYIDFLYIDQLKIVFEADKTKELSKDHWSILNKKIYIPRPEEVVFPKEDNNVRDLRIIRTTELIQPLNLFEGRKHLSSFEKALDRITMIFQEMRPKIRNKTGDITDIKNIISPVNASRPLLTQEELLEKGISNSLYLTYGWLVSGFKGDEETSLFNEALNRVSDPTAFKSFAITAYGGCETDLTVAFPNLGSRVSALGFIAVRENSEITNIKSFTFQEEEELRLAGGTFKKPPVLVRVGGMNYKVYYMNTCMWTDINVYYPYQVFIKKGV